MPEDPRTAPLEKAVHEDMRSSLVGIGANRVLAAFKCLAGYRTQEMGIRLALGAMRFDVLWLIVRQGLLSALSGVGIGSLA